MKPNRRFLTPLIPALLLFLGDGLADKPIPPPPAGRFIGVWVGYDSHFASFYRLEIEEGAKGYCARIFMDQPPKLYRINHWEVIGNELKLRLEPTGDGMEKIEMQSTAPVGSSIVLQMEVGAVDGSWKRGLELFNEKEFSSRNTQLKEGLLAYRTRERQGQK